MACCQISQHLLGLSKGLFSSNELPESGALRPWRTESLDCFEAAALSTAGRQLGGALCRAQAGAANELSPSLMGKELLTRYSISVKDGCLGWSSMILSTVCRKGFGIVEQKCTKSYADVSLGFDII